MTVSRQACVAVAILTCEAPGVLMQLRDFREDIACPGQWGLFGGAVEGSESAEDAVMREVREELGVSLSTVRFLAPFEFESPEVRHEVFLGAIPCRTDQLRLFEGQELGAFSLKQISQGALPSRRHGKAFPVAPASRRILAWAARHHLEAAASTLAT